MGTVAEEIEAFQRLRQRLFGIAYRMLGTVEEAEDVLQSAYLRWQATDRAAVRNPEGWLITATTRLAIDRLRQLAGERARYASDWLPEPIATGAPTAEQQAELASDLSMAFLVLLERLSPDERAALLLHDVFGAGYAEIARVLDRSEAACRQVVHRARQRVRADRARFEVPLEAKERLVERFLATLAARDEQGLLALVAEDATWTADGGGKVPAARKLRGAARIVRFLLAIDRKGAGLVRRQLGWINGEPAVVTYVGDRVAATISIDTDGDRVHAFYSMVNPDKLRRAADGGPGR